MSNQMHRLQTLEQIIRDFADQLVENEAQDYLL